MRESAVPIELESAADLLARVDALRDDEPSRALEMLRRIDADALPAASLPRLAFLLNHVPGRKLARWTEALAGQCAVLNAAGAAMTPTLWRHATIAAQLAGNTALASAWMSSLAAGGQAPIADARALAALGATGLSIPLLDAASAGRACLHALAPLAALHAQPATGLDASFAAVAGELTGDLLERPPRAFDQPDLRAALSLSARHAQRFWARTARWQEIARAHHLGARAANTLGNGMEGATYARAGLRVLAAHDHEDAGRADRAFMELELSLGLHLAEMSGAAEAHERATIIAATIEDARWRDEFTRVERRNRALAKHHGRD